jgi:hypothetical protein
VHRHVCTGRALCYASDVIVVTDASETRCWDSSWVATALVLAVVIFVSDEWHRRGRPSLRQLSALGSADGFEPLLDVDSEIPFAIATPPLRCHSGDLLRSEAVEPVSPFAD